MRSPVSRLLLLCLLFALVGPATGCAWLHAKQIAKRTNPKYRSAVIPGPTRVIPIFACPRERRGVTPDASSRRRLLTDVVPALWRAAGGNGEPALGDEPTPVLCQEFLEDEDYPSWAGNDALRGAVAGLLADGEQSVLTVFLALTYGCEEKTGSVRDANGVLVGTVGTGDEVCAENGGAFLFAYLLSADGEIVWHSGAEVSLHDDAAAMSRSLFEGFPRDRVTLAAP